MNNNQDNIESLDLNNDLTNQNPSSFSMNNQNLNNQGISPEMPRRVEPDNTANINSGTQTQFNMNYNQSVNSSQGNQINHVDSNYQANMNQAINQTNINSQQGYQNGPNQLGFQQNTQNGSYQLNNNQGANQIPQQQPNNYNSQNFVQTTPASQPNNANNTFLIIVIVLLSVICVLGGIYVVTSNRKNVGNNGISNNSTTTAAPISNSSTTTIVQSSKTYSLNGFELSFNDNYIIQDRKEQGLYLSRRNSSDFSAVTIDSGVTYDYYVTYRQQLADELKRETDGWSITNIGEITVSNKNWLEISGKYSGDVMSMYISAIKDASFIVMYRGNTDNSRAYLTDFNTTISNSKTISNFSKGDKDSSFFENAKFDMIFSK